MTRLKVLFKNYITVFWAALLGLTLSLVAAQSSISFEEDFFQQVFDQRADNHSAAIEQGLHLMQIQGVQLLRQLAIEEDDVLDVAEFQAIAAQFRNDSPVFHDFIWLPIEHMHTLKDLLPLDLANPELYVSLMDNSVFGTTENKPFFKLLTKTLQHSFVDPQETLLVLDTGEASAFHILPLFDRADEQPELLGLLLLHWHLGDAVEFAISPFPKSGMDFEIRHINTMILDDVTADYVHLSRTRAQAETLDYNRIFKHKNAFDLLDQRWMLSYNSAPVFISEHPLTMVWQTAIAGLIMTLLICAIVLLLARRTYSVEKLVAQKTAELQESEARFRQMIEHMPVGIAVHKEGIIEYLNPFFLKIIGGKALDEVIGERVLKFVHPDDHARVIEDAQHALTGDDVHSMPVRYITSDGERQTHEMLASRTSIVTDGVLSSVTIALDVTEQNKAQRALQLQYQTLQAVLDASPVGIWMVNAEGRMTLLNQAFAKAVHSSEAALLQVAHYQDVLSKDIANQVLASDAACLEKHAMYHGVETYKDDKGASHVYEVIKVPLYADEDNTLLGVVGVCLDISARLAAEAAQERVQKKAEEAQHLESLGVLAGGIAHDFNNLLSVILGNAALAGKRLDDQSIVTPYLQRIEHASEKAAGLCQQMLAYAGKGQFLMKQVDLSEVVHDMALLLEVSLHKHVQVEYNLASHLDLIEVDSAQIQQVIMNLVTNANEAMDEQLGKMYIKTAMTTVFAAGLPHLIGQEDVREGDYVYMEVRDEGCGMDEQTQGRMFEPFFTTKFTGRGLGMSAMLGMVRSHEGMIQVQSSLGQGSVFRVYFPVVAKQEVRQDVKEQEPALVGQTDWQGSGKILVVDDEADVLETVGLMIEDFGFEVVSAVDGVEALAIYQQQGAQISLILMDMTMPRMNGKRCTIEILKVNPEAKIVLCSGYSEEEAELEFKGLALAGFLQKPFHPDKLQLTIEQLLE